VFPEAAPGPTLVRSDRDSLGLQGRGMGMRVSDEQTGSLFSYVSCEARVPGHPLRLIRAVVDEALDVLSPEFDQLYAGVGSPAIAPKSCCGRCCCKRSTRSARNGN